jgi:hypothetical protein
MQISFPARAWTVFVRTDAGIVGSNPTQGMDFWCMRLFCVCVVLCLGSGLAAGWSLVQGDLPSVKNDQKWIRDLRPERAGRAIEEKKR